jgi:hypothetical protein
MRIVAYSYRPGSRTLMTRRAGCDARDKVCRRLFRYCVSRIVTIKVTRVTGLTRFKRDHRMIHRRVGEGAPRILMTTVTIDFRATVFNRYVRQRIGVTEDIRIR